MCLCALKNSSYSMSIPKFSAIEMCSRVIDISGSIMILVGGTVRLLAIDLCEMQIGLIQKRNVLGTQKVAFLGIYKPQTAMWTSCSLNTCLHPEQDSDLVGGVVVSVSKSELCMNLAGILILFFCNGTVWYSRMCR